jgi:GNAT superfamily N-acetyltransferase
MVKMREKERLVKKLIFSKNWEQWSLFFILSGMIHIRPATSNDLPLLYSLWVELMEAHSNYHRIFSLDEANKPNIEVLLEKRLAESNNQILVAEWQGKVGGMIMISFRQKPEAMQIRRQGYIAETVVAENFRGKGLGTALFEAAESWFSDQAADHIELQVSINNEGARRFWQSKGFASFSHQMIKVVE